MAVATVPAPMRVRREGLRLPGGTGGATTLDDVLSGAWEGLAAGRAVACPVCRGDLRPRPTAGSRPAGGRCGRCGTELS